MLERGNPLCIFRASFLNPLSKKRIEKGGSHTDESAVAVG